MKVSTTSKISENELQKAEIGSQRLIRGPLRWHLLLIANKLNNLFLFWKLQNWNDRNATTEKKPPPTPHLLNANCSHCRTLNSPIACVFSLQSLPCTARNRSCESDSETLFREAFRDCENHLNGRRNIRSRSRCWRSLGLYSSRQFFPASKG